MRKEYRSKWEELRELFGTTCVYCGEQPATCIDHVIPVSYIEDNDIENLRPSCSWCNLAVSNQVFETFEQKRQWIQADREKKRFSTHRTVCCTCWIPYQAPLHSPNLLFCPVCHDHEYGTQFSKGKEWLAWLDLLSVAELPTELHIRFGNEIRENPDLANLRTKKRQLWNNMMSATIFPIQLPNSP